MKKHIGLYFLIFSFVVALTSCTSTAVKSTWVDAPKIASSDQATNANIQATEGIAYALPMVLFHLTAVLTNVPDPTAPTPTVTMTAISNSYTTTTYINQTNTNAVYYVTNVCATNAALKIISTNYDSVIITNTTIQFASNSVVIPGQDTNTLIRAYAITVEPVVSQDPSHQYALTFPEGIGTSDDDYGITVDPTNGLLQTVNATNADQTGNIIASLAQAAASIYTMGAGGTTLPVYKIQNTSLANGTGPLKTNWPGRIEVYFDPTVRDGSNGIDAANETISKEFSKADSKWGTNVPIQLGATFFGKKVELETEKYSFWEQPQKKTKGILYRPLLPYIIQITNDHGPSGESESVQYLLRSPNAAPVFSLPVKRALFVTRTTSISFNDGFLQGVNYHNPSQIAAVLELPLTVVNGVFSTVTNVLQLRLNIATAQSNIATQQTALINQMAAMNVATSNLLESAQQLNALKSSLTNKP